MYGVFSCILPVSVGVSSMFKFLSLSCVFPRFSVTLTKIKCLLKLEDDVGPFLQIVVSDADQALNWIAVNKVPGFGVFFGGERIFHSIFQPQFAT